MIRTGVFTIVNGESRLSDGTLLAICSDPSPLVAARPFLLGRQCQQNHWVEVTGTFGPVGGMTAFCMTDAQPIAPPPEPQESVVATPNESVTTTERLVPSKPQRTKKKNPNQRSAMGKKASSATSNTQNKK
jgi:hypothetical protein